jgi:hypothetical protein
MRLPDARRQWKENEMQAYHGNATLKARFVELIESHRAADRIVQGRYWERGKGCAIGCSIESMRVLSERNDLAHDNHAVYEEMIGVPRVLARLEDGIFEGLPANVAQSWPGRFAAAIRPGSDLSRVWPQFAVWLLIDPNDGVIRFARTNKARGAIQHVADLYRRQLDGTVVELSEWQNASAAYADADAYAAADPAADAAAYAVGDAYAAADAAAYAAAYAAADIATYAVWQQARMRQADYLIALLEAA